MIDLESPGKSLSELKTLDDLKAFEGKTGIYRVTTYPIWMALISRCYNENDRSYSYYGGRGITVCKRWLDFVNFYVDMYPKPKDKSLDRINNDLGYFPVACSTASERLNHDQQNDS